MAGISASNDPRGAAPTLLARRAMSQEDTRDKLLETLKNFDTLMVISEARDGSLRGRPMAVAEVTPSCELWFATSRETEKVREARVAERALATGQTSGAYVSVSGRMEIVEDRAKVHGLWNEAWKIWFPAGKDDPQIVLMRLRPEIGEYWRRDGTAGFHFLFEAAKALIAGERAPDGGPDQHGQVRL
jgi:general stress protein 26